ncbi:hypothetical protein F5883DRAFT_52700 [Diaporthe sp. PMI_573]|nr:hypothetical protein F5883DRAFT_52700 [Diaporthaceae sp. PMI_573]
MKPMFCPPSLSPSDRNRFRIQHLSSLALSCLFLCMTAARPLLDLNLCLELWPSTGAGGPPLLKLCGAGSHVPS